MKLSTEAVGSAMIGREHSIPRRRRGVSHSGAYGKEIGISNDKGGEKPPRRKTKVS